MRKSGGSVNGEGRKIDSVSFLAGIVTDVSLAFRIGIIGLVRPGRTRVIPQQLRGAILGIGLSIVPLLVVIVITNGMIDGITKRLIEINTYHAQVTFYGRPSRDLLTETRDAVAREKGVTFAFVERDGFVQLRHDDNISGTTLRCVPPELFELDEGFRHYFEVLDGEGSLPDLPGKIRKDAFEEKILPVLPEEKKRIMSLAYEEDPGIGMYVLGSGMDGDTLARVREAFTASGSSTILIGKALSEKLGTKPGDMVYLLSFFEFHSRIIPKSGKAVVTGIFSTGYQYIDKFLAYIPYDEGIGLVPQNRSSSKDLIGVKVEDPFGDMNAIVGSVNTMLQNNNVFADAQSWYELQINQYRSLELTKTLLIFIMILIVIVAAANVYSSIVMIVMDRTQEIAILKSMGARPSTISLSFLLTGFYTGGMGALLGMVIGLLVAVNINEIFKLVERAINGIIWIFDKIMSPFYRMGEQEAVVILNPQFYLEKIPIKISALELIFVAIITIFLSVVSAVLPARNAGSIRPIEIIRKY